MTTNGNGTMTKLQKGRTLTKLQLVQQRAGDTSGRKEYECQGIGENPPSHCSHCVRCLVT